jgi:gluconokinase
MGVSGSGKTTVAAMLAGRLHWAFEEGDSLHPPENVAKMHSGIPLTDEDRLPWLRVVAAWIDHWRERREHGIITCSALKRAYRRIIIGDRSDVRLVYLKGDQSLIAKRLAARHGHFMPPSLLQSQFDALEEPGPDENPIVVPIGASPREIVDMIQARLIAEGGTANPL